MVMSKEEAGLDDDEPGGKFLENNGFSDKIVLGAIEGVLIGSDEIMARVDSGASKSSICESLVSRFGLGPIVGTTEIKSANGVEIRDVIEFPFRVAGKDIVAKFSVANRSNMKYSLLIGRNVLNKGFLVDVAK